ncbi:hypothetical protein HY572_07140 [Candidatus Micrarchaeota archaeon]|nr:hypothetical protein [Candidatus Micrarchaeota archaeon]
MKKCTDLHVGPGAKAFAESLGWQVRGPATVFLDTDQDGGRVKKGDAVASINSMGLRKAAKKQVLVDPTHVVRFEKDEGLVRAVAETPSAFELPLRLLLHASGRRRARLVEAYKAFWALCQKRKAKWFITSQAENAWDVKHPREVLAIIQQFGPSKLQAQQMLEEAGTWP